MFSANAEAARQEAQRSQEARDQQAREREQEFRERAQFWGPYARGHDAPAHAVAVALGQATRVFGTGRILLMLREEIDAGRLRTADDVRTVQYGEERMPRRNWASVPIDRDDLRAWLLEFGTPEMHVSLAAVWCGLCSFAEAERHALGLPLATA